MTPAGMARKKHTRCIHPRSSGFGGAARRQTSAHSVRPPARKSGGGWRMPRHDAAVPASTARAELAAGARAVAPMLIGVIPFGLVAGATPVATGLGGGVSIGLSTIVFAGRQPAGGGRRAGRRGVGGRRGDRGLHHQPAADALLGVARPAPGGGAAAPPPDDRLPPHRPGLRGVDRPLDEGGRRRGGRRTARARARPQAPLLLRRRADAVGELAGVHDRRRLRRLGAARLAAARLRGAAGVPRAPRARHHLAARRRWPRSSAVAWPCSRPRPAPATSACCSARWPASSPARSPRRSSSGGPPVDDTPLAPDPGLGAVSERLGRHRPGRHRHLRDARVVPRVRPPARRRAAQRAAAAAPDPAGRPGRHRDPRAAPARGLPRRLAAAALRRDPRGGRGLAHPQHRRHPHRRHRPRDDPRGGRR